jgi:hypothetical protein
MDGRIVVRRARAAARGEGTVEIPQDVPNLADANFVLRLR